MRSPWEDTQKREGQGGEVCWGSSPGKTEQKRKPKRSNKEPRSAASSQFHELLKGRTQPHLSTAGGFPTRQLRRGVRYAPTQKQSFQGRYKWINSFFLSGSPPKGGKTGSGPVGCPETRTGLGPVLSLGNFIVYTQAVGLSSSVDCDGVCLWGILSLFLSHHFLKFIIRADKSAFTPPHTSYRRKQEWLANHGAGKGAGGCGEATHFCITRA